MPAVSTAVFARRLRSLDEAELLAFVADIWAARGFDTTVEDGTVVAERPDGLGRERIAVGRNPPFPAVDVVVDVSQEPLVPVDGGVRVLGVTELHEMFLFAIDRPTAETLAEAHLGRPLEAEGRSQPLRVGLRAVPLRPIFLIALLAVGVVVVGFGLPSGEPAVEEPGGPIPTALDPPTATATPVPFQATRIPLVMAGPDRDPGNREPVRHPPGIDATGITSAESLAAAHRSGLADERWTLRIDHDGSHDLLHPARTWASAEQTVIRTAPTRYRFDVVGVAELPGDSVTTVTYVDYGDGEANYRRVLGPTSIAFSRTELPNAGPSGAFASVSAAYVRRYLSTTETSVEPFTLEGMDRFLVVSTGSPTELSRPVADYRAIAVVDRSGVVRRLVVEYTLLDGADERLSTPVTVPKATTDTRTIEPVTRVRFRMVVDDLGSAALTAPSWYDQARTATNTSRRPWPNDPPR